MPPRRTVLQGGRAKAYRPLPASRRRAALVEALAAYDRGDAFLAHELLEPAWMGTADAAERELYQGLIKLAAAEVHRVRGNPAGEAKNLRGARARLAAAEASGGRGTGGRHTGGREDGGRDAGGRDAGLDLAGLLAAVAARLAELEGAPPAPPIASGSGGSTGPLIAIPRRVRD